MSACALCISVLTQRDKHNEEIPKQIPPMGLKRDAANLGRIQMRFNSLQTGKCIAGTVQNTSPTPKQNPSFNSLQTENPCNRQGCEKPRK